MLAVLICEVATSCAGSHAKAVNMSNLHSYKRLGTADSCVVHLRPSTGGLDIKNYFKCN